MPIECFQVIYQTYLLIIPLNVVSIYWGIFFLEGVLDVFIFGGAWGVNNNIRYNLIFRLY